jgi:hypothetical protein
MSVCFISSDLLNLDEMNFQFDPNQIMIAMNTSNSQTGMSIQDQQSPKNICAICSDKASGKHYGVHR